MKNSIPMHINKKYLHQITPKVVPPSAVWVSPGVSDQQGPEAAGGWWRVQMVYGGGREDGDLSA